MIPNLIVPVLNRHDLLQRMLDSIDYPIGHLLIIDNGPNEPYNLTIPESIDEVTYLPMPANLGVADSWNLGIKCFPHHDRWFFASNDMWFESGALEILAQARPQNLTLADSFPYWQTFAIGEEVIKRVGLFSMDFYPAYFEDNDMMRRVEHFGFDVIKLPLRIGHDNSSTINSNGDYKRVNGQTFTDNKKRFDRKVETRDFECGHWDLTVRRNNEWDMSR